MSNKIITYKDQMFGVWKVLEPNVINPNTKATTYIGRAVFSKCICTACNETIRYIRNNELKKYSSHKCRTCAKRENVEKNQPKIGDRFGKLIIIGDGGYHNKRHYSKCQCDCGNIVIIKDNSLKTGNTQSCGCIISKGEEKIKTLLDSNKIIYNHNIVYPPFLQETGKQYRFDFIIYNNDGTINRFIEFDGRQHLYGPDTNFWSKTTDTLKDIQYRDNIKNTWCKNHNYILIRIPFYQLDKITINDLFDDKYKIQ